MVISFYPRSNSGIFLLYAIKIGGSMQDGK